MKLYAVVAAVVALTAGAGAGKPKLYVLWAASWNDAVTEAQALNMPIVVHRHGFY